MLDYNPKIVALVIDIHKKTNIDFVKKELVEFIKTFEFDDRIYLLNDDGCSFNHKSNAIPYLSNYPFGEHEIEHLMRDSVITLNLEADEYDADKILFVISDKSSFDAYQVEKMFNLASRSNCKTFVYEVGTSVKFKPLTEKFEMKHYSVKNTETMFQNMIGNKNESIR